MATASAVEEEQGEDAGDKHDERPDAGHQGERQFVEFGAALGGHCKWGVGGGRRGRRREREGERERGREGERG